MIHQTFYEWQSRLFILLKRFANVVRRAQAGKKARHGGSVLNPSQKSAARHGRNNVSRITDNSQWAMSQTIRFVFGYWCSAQYTC